MNKKLDNFKGWVDDSKVRACPICGVRFIAGRQGVEFCSRACSVGQRKKLKALGSPTKPLYKVSMNPSGPIILG